jgi:hypothetical protein
MYMQHLPVQVKCTNKFLLELVDKIRSFDPDPIIIVHGDHGTSIQNQLFRRTEASKRTTETDISDLRKLTDWERREIMAVFNVYLVPERCKDLLYPSITPVNSMRVALSCIEKTPRQLLKDRVFLTFYDNDPKRGIIAVEWDPWAKPASSSETR